MYCWDVSKAEQNGLTVINVTATILSFIGSLATIIFFLRSRDKKQKMNQLIFFLAITDFGASIILLVGTFVAQFSKEGQPQNFCVLNRVLLQFFYVSSFFWTTCIAIHMYRAINHLPQYSALYIGFHIVSWVVPAVLSIIEGAAGLVVKASNAAWCDLEDRYEWGLWFVPMIASVLLNFILFIAVLISLKRREATSIQKRIESQAIKKLSLYLLAFVVCWIWNIIDRIIHEINPDCKVYPLWVLQDFFSPLQGFLNFIVYGLSGNMIQRSFISYNEYSRRAESQPLNAPVNF